MGSGVKSGKSPGWRGPRTWKRGLDHAPWAAAAAGAVGAGGFAPLGWPGLLIAACAVLIHLCAGVGWRRGALLGFLFGLGHFTLSLSWLLTSLRDNGGIPTPLAVAILMLLAAALALYPALFGALLAKIAPRPALWPLAAPALWVLTEGLRAHLWTGFPWNLAGYAWDRFPAIIQSADLGGVYLLSGLILLLAACLAWALSSPWRVGQAVAALLVAGLILGAAQGYGLWRLATLAAPSNGETLRALLVQANIQQALKWDRRFREPTLRIYGGLTAGAGGAGTRGGGEGRPVDLAIWPETAIPLFLQLFPEHRKALGELSRAIGAPILSGVPLADPEDGGRGEYRYFNSAVLLDASAEMVRRYDKHHLVPFGEFIPLRWLVPETVTRFTGTGKDFSRGPGPVPIAGPRGPLGVLICYEAIFPDEVRRLSVAGARWLVNLTNDGWFGPAARPQHLAMARLRAVENRLPMIRVANTGISAVFDHAGVEVARIEAGRREAAVVDVPPGIGASFYRNSGAGWFLLWVGLAALSGVIGWRFPPVASMKVKPE